MFAIDKSRAKKPFGGITIVFGGDFRQILPVIPKASGAEVFCSTLNKSKLWESCEVFLLKQNMRLNAGNSDLENKTIADFSKWQLAVSDGKETNISPSPDTGDDDNDFRSVFPVEYLNSINMSCIPKHELKLKGQSLDTVGLYLPKADFSHGHIYVAISIVTRPEGLHILIDSDDGISTDITNYVVFEEVFYNLPSVDN
ncbi:uncharacterized protein LOC141665859 [Apium graveolens]|uniref:uncharacterized protein LOC141665859 n=1 Tax=Apium graveolens TaxID=4045 RepID=UPI003D7BA2A8